LSTSLSGIGTQLSAGADVGEVPGDGVGAGEAGAALTVFRS
jgi:hypothetical protein